MKSALLKKYPPYEGQEPYIYLCFAHEDEKAVEPLLSRLWKRGCRVWYTVGESTTVAREEAVQNRMKNARVAVVFCSETFLRSSAKSRMMFLQSRKTPIISVDSTDADDLSGGFRDGTPHIAAREGITDQVEAELITSRGFSQDLIGERPRETVSGWKKALLAVLSALVLAALVFLGLTVTGVLRPTREIPKDEITVLALDKLPEDLSTLAEYPRLEKLLLPQSEAERASELLDTYTVVLTGEGN